MSGLHEMTNYELIESIQADLESSHRSLAETVYRFAYNRGDDDLAERKRHLTERIALLDTALASARSTENYAANRRVAAAIQAHHDKVLGDSVVEPE